MRASIIIPAFNAEKSLAECLAACLAQDSAGFEIIVVDDGSTDATAEIARGFSGVRVISKENAGPAAARNAGAEAANGEFLVFTDSDCVPRPDWLTRLLDGLEEGIVAVGGTYACINQKSRLARVIQAEIDLRHRRFAAEVDFLGTFNVAYRATAFQEAGGFNEEYREASGEDNDLAYRLQDGGGRLRFTSKAIVGHYHPEKLLPYLRNQSRHGFWRMKLYRDHPKRAGGDQYAGRLDFLAPPLGITMLTLVPVLFACWSSGWTWADTATGVYLLILPFYLTLHVPKVWRLCYACSLSDLLYFWLMVCLRDIARALGLVRGLWHFRILGRRA